MPAWTLEQARAHLQAWLNADIVLATGKEYRIGSRALTRGDATEVKERIQFWSREVSRLQGKSRRCRRVVPLDT